MAGLGILGQVRGFAGNSSTSPSQPVAAQAFGAGNSVSAKAAPSASPKATTLFAATVAVGFGLLFLVWYSAPA